MSVEVLCKSVGQTEGEWSGVEGDQLSVLRSGSNGSGLCRDQSCRCGLAGAMAHSLLAL